MIVVAPNVVVAVEVLIAWSTKIVTIVVPSVTNDAWLDRDVVFGDTNSRKRTIPKLSWIVWNFVSIPKSNDQSVVFDD